MAYSNEISKTRARIRRIVDNGAGVKLMHITIEGIEHIVPAQDAPRHIYCIMSQYGLIKNNTPVWGGVALERALIAIKDALGRV